MCMPRSSLITDELIEGFSDPDKTFKALNCAKKKDKQIPHQQERFESETVMGDNLNNNNNNPNTPQILGRLVAPLVPEDALWA